MMGYFVLIMETIPKYLNIDFYYSSYYCKNIKTLKFVTTIITQ